MRRREIVETPFQRIEVWESDTCCEFRVAGAVHAWWHRDRFLTGLAWDNLAAGCLLRQAGPPESILMLGLAGGTTLRILRHLLPQCRFVSVDVDEGVVEAARQHMHLDDNGVEVHLADAYEWAKGCRERFDVVIDDCYLAGEEDVFRPERKPERGIEVLKGLLKPGGVFLTNLVTGAGHRRIQSRTRAAFRRAFEEVRSVTTPDSLNETLVGGDVVLSGRVLDEWEACFAKKRDRDLWRRVSVRGLKVGGSKP